MNRLLRTAVLLAMASPLCSQGFGSVFIKLGKSMLPAPLVQGGQPAQAAKSQPRFDNKVYHLTRRLKEKRRRKPSRKPTSVATNIDEGGVAGVVVIPPGAARDRK